MRHGKKFNHLGRKSAHRKAMLANMASSLIEHKRIRTTVAKAKALQKYIEPLVTKSKTDSTHSRRTIFRYLQSKDAVNELFREVAPKIGDRPGGYTRIIKLAPRLGDAAEMAYIELVDFNELMLAESKPKASGKKRSRRGGKKATDAPKAAPAADTKEEVEEVKAEAKAEEVAEETAEEVVEDEPEATAEAAEESTEENTEDSKEDDNNEEEKDDKA